ncbi:MAG: cation:proton antiporter [Terracidiphilus sp.]|nr:cation:proton antiporter [Terracidiphilus sp.]
MNMDPYSDALVVLGTAGILVPLLRKWGLNPILGYLCAGALLGPMGLGALTGHFPALYWCTIANAHGIEAIAELGIVFLLFRIGIEMSLKRMKRMGVLVAGLGSLQIVLTAALIWAVARAWGQPQAAAIVLGVSLSLSSTAIVLELLSKQGRMSTGVGRASFAVLLAQDLTVIPLLMYISLGGSGGGSAAWINLLRALVQAGIALTVIVVASRVLMRPLFRLVGSAHSTDLFIAAVLFVVLAAGVIAHLSGLSMALGAFVAGILLAETEYRKAIQAVVEPFKGILLGVFFFSIGMSIDFHAILREPSWLLAAVCGLIFAKAAILTLLGKLFRLSWPTATEVGLLLGPGGEFAFVGIGMAAGLGMVDAQVAGFTLAAVSLTMATTPLLSMAARRFSAAIRRAEGVTPMELLLKPAARKQTAIVVGYGRVGKVVCGFFREHGVPYIATDNDPQVVIEGRHDGEEIFFGDASHVEFLQACGLDEASGLIVTINAHEAIDNIVAIARVLRPEVPIVARAHDANHARHLYEKGVSSAVPETIEASLQLSEAALVGVGVAKDAASDSIHRQREAFHEELHVLRQRALEASK